MIAYFIIPIFLYIFSITNLKDKYLRKIVFTCISIFLCTTYFNGSDWRQYELIYKDVGILSIKSFHMEKGFYFYMLFFKFFDIDFWTFFIITKFLCFYYIYKWIIINSSNYYLFFNIFYGILGLSLFIDTPLRNLIAVAIVLNFQKYIIRKKYFLFIIGVLLAFTFHGSAIFFLVLIFEDKIYKIGKKKFLFVFILAYIIFSNQKLLIDILRNIPLFEERLELYIGTEYSEAKLLSLGVFEKILVFFLLIYNKEKFFKTPKRQVIWGNTIFYIIFHRIGVSFPILGRLTLYVSVFYFESIVILTNGIKNSKNRVLIITLILLFECLIIYKTIKNTYKYLPYSSYITYIGLEKPSYKYRSEYNFINNNINKKE